MVLYLIGSLRNPQVPVVAERLRWEGYDVYDDWWAPGEHTDTYWQNYEKARGHTFQQALRGYHACQTFQWDKHHLDRADMGVLVLPAGKSGHLELGYLIGQGKPGYILLDAEPTRYDLMYSFAAEVANDLDELIKCLPSPRP